MADDTVRTRVQALLQRSRKALRLYSSVGRQGRPKGDLSEMQASEWRAVNSHLSDQLTSMLDLPGQRRLVAELFLLRDAISSEHRLLSDDLQVKGNECQDAVTTGDYVRCHTLSRELVALKARTQATSAVYHELEQIINRSRLSRPAVELYRDEILAHESSLDDAIDDRWRGITARAKKTVFERNTEDDYDVVEPQLAQVISIESRKRNRA